MSERCEHQRIFYRDLLTGAPPERRCGECNELLPPLPTIADLEAENARLQAQVEHAKDTLIRTAGAWHRSQTLVLEERDGYKARAERRGEALVRTGKWERLPDGYLMCTVCCTGTRCECGPGEHVSREGCPNCLGYSGAALAATPELTNC